MLFKAYKNTFALILIGLMIRFGTMIFWQTKQKKIGCKISPHSILFLSDDNGDYYRNRFSFSFFLSSFLSFIWIENVENLWSIFSIFFYIFKFSFLVDSFIERLIYPEYRIKRKQHCLQWFIIIIYEKEMMTLL